MSGVFRLPTGGRIDRGRIIAFTFDGQQGRAPDCFQIDFSAMLCQFAPEQVVGLKHLGNRLRIKRCSPCRVERPS